jgi:hypothetical protein
MDDMKRLIGSAIEKALTSADITKQAAAYEMGYGENHAPVSNWIAGKETPQFAKLWTLGAVFQRELVIALANLCQQVEVRTVVTIERRRA